MGTYSKAIRRAVEAQIARQDAKNPPVVSAKPELKSRGIYVGILAIALVILYVFNFVFIYKFYNLSKDKDARVKHSFENADETRQYLKDVKKQLNSVSQELSEFRTTLNLAAQKMKEDAYISAETQKRLDGLDFSLHNLVKAKDQLFTRVGELESKVTSGPNVVKKGDQI